MSKPANSPRAPEETCCTETNDLSCCVPRREFVKLLGVSVAAAATVTRRLPVMAGPFPGGNRYLKVIPQDKRLDADWVRSLYERGKKQTYTGADLKFIGMPVGGIGVGCVYLGGDGRLWLWDIFNQNHGRGLLSRGMWGETFLSPLEQSQRFEQRFELQVKQDDGQQRRTLDRDGFTEITFDGRYPLGTVSYHDPQCPVDVKLAAFSPFIPLDLKNSSYPATILQYTLTNRSDRPLTATVAGRTENPICLFTGNGEDTQRRNRILQRDSATILQCSAEKAQPTTTPTQESRPDIVFEDFEKPTYEGWTVAGTAFGTGPVQKKDLPEYQGEVRGVGERIVNSHASAPGADVVAKDVPVGSLTSKPFKIERAFIRFLIGGGSHEGTAVELLIDGEVAERASGKNQNEMKTAYFNVAQHNGKQAQLRITDQVAGGWGNVGVDQIVFCDIEPGKEPGAFEDRHDLGTLALAIVGKPNQATANSPADNWFANATDAAVQRIGDPLCGAVGQTLELKPGESATVSFIYAWHFPNLDLTAVGRMGRWYTPHFADAAAVAAHIAENLDQLAGETRCWVDTWYDSTLPYWLLDRAMANTTTLASNTCFLFGDGRFYGWEGVTCCEGTCTHVWHYAQAPGRLFPEIERRTRIMVDYDLGFFENGGIAHRTMQEGNRYSPADDGQCGRILGVLREHQTSADDQFLRNLWPKVKKSIEYMIARDPNHDGILDGPQPNTLDADWYGEISFTSSLYLAALRAGATLAREMGDEPFAQECDRIAEVGAKRMLDLFNGEYFIQIEDPKHAEAIGTGPGCYIDQIFGQTWAHWVGLGHLFDRERQLTALRSLWKYNFVPDVGPFRKEFPEGRWYAKAGDAGLIMCSWPKESVDPEKKKHWQYMYFNECMTGFEWQAAAHMIYEGLDNPDLLEYGLAISKAIHDRYDATLRNPYNEIECSDHYARAMASYGAFQALCGFEYHGPKGFIGFAPRLTPANFRAPFTAAEGWGTYDQKIENGKLTAEFDLKYGKLQLKTISLGLTEGLKPNAATVTAKGAPIKAELKVADGKAVVTLAKDIVIDKGDVLQVVLG